MNWKHISFCHGWYEGFSNQRKSCPWNGPRVEDWHKGYKAGAQERERMDSLKRTERLILSDFGLSNHIRLMKEQIEIMKSQQIEVKIGKQTELLLRDAPPGYYELWVGIGDVQWVPVIVSRHTPPGCQAQTVAINLQNPAVTYLGNVRGNNAVRIPESPLELKVTF